MRNSVIVAGDAWIGSTVDSVIHGFKNIDWDVAGINPSNFISRANSRFSKIINKLVYRSAVHQYNDEIISLAISMRADVFLAVKGSYILSETIEELKSLGVVTVNYYPDVHFSFKQLNVDSLAKYDLFFTTKSFQLEYLRNLLGEEKVFFLHHGYSDYVHRPPVPQLLNSYVHDLVYIGTYSDSKKHFLESIKNEFTSINFSIYGNGWNKIGRSNLQKCIEGVALNSSAYARTINSSKINLAIHSGVVDSSGWEDLVSTRTFEIPACKGFMLHVDSKEVNELFNTDSEISTFHDEMTLCEKIEEFLTDDSRRNEMTELAYQRCVPNYGYNYRVKAISNKLQNLLT